MGRRGLLPEGFGVVEILNHLLEITATHPPEENVSGRGTLVREAVVVIKLRGEVSWVMDGLHLFNHSSGPGP